MSDHKHEDPTLADVDERELAEARALREALEGEGNHEDLALISALKSAWNPASLHDAENKLLIERAIRRADRGKGRLIRLSFGVAAAFAAAAAVALVLLRSEVFESQSSVVSASLLRSRSAQDLFDAPFPRTGGTTDRIDRIASSRSRDFRTNQFDRMGVR
jgi:hypothetical protein